MERHIDFHRYQKFVDATTSQPSKDFSDFADRLNDLKIQGFPTERLLTAAVGMSAEAGEFTEIVKKIVFQGKPVTQENLFHLSVNLETLCGMLLKPVWVLRFLLKK